MLRKTYELNLFLNSFLTILYLFNFSKSSNIFLDNQYLTSLTLLDGKILMLTENSAILYDYKLNNTLKTFTFADEITSDSQNCGTTLEQFPSNYGSYIIILRNNYFYIFDKSLNSRCLAITADTVITSYSNYYSLTPYYKDINDNLHFILSFKSTAKEITIIHFIFSLTYCSVKKVTEKKFNPSFIYDPNHNNNKIQELFGPSCNLMSSNNTNVLACFYDIVSPEYL